MTIIIIEAVIDLFLLLFSLCVIILYIIKYDYRI